ncbi:Hypothetical predicted protein [Pelobates cultripes]|uniref:Uncharacterized protein n=1 Tax=Pelobates cultripes TaxID=61616 RepID=A0AAD1TEQ2_PELCU|nr:Hypothetical predicted protein [Pelobates cultripes]
MKLPVYVTAPVKSTGQLASTFPPHPEGSNWADRASPHVPSITGHTSGALAVRPHSHQSAEGPARLTAMGGISLQASGQPKGRVPAYLTGTSPVRTLQYRASNPPGHLHNTGAVCFLKELRFLQRTSGVRLCK